MLSILYFISEYKKKYNWIKGIYFLKKTGRYISLTQILIFHIQWARISEPCILVLMIPVVKLIYKIHYILYYVCSLHLCADIFHIRFVSERNPETKTFTIYKKISIKNNKKTSSWAVMRWSTYVFMGSGRP